VRSDILPLLFLPLTLPNSFEGAFTPGVTLILSEFYRPRQLQLRLAMFFSMVSMAGAFGGCIAYGITTTLGRTWNNGSYPGWCYIVRCPCPLPTLPRSSISSSSSRAPSRLAPACSSCSPA
jgi:MFS family permease